MSSNYGSYVPSVYVAQVNSVLQAAQRFGADRNEILRVARIEQSWLRSPEDRVPLQRLFDACRAAELLTGQSDIGVYAGRIQYVDGTNLQLYMATICESFRDYLNLVPSILKLQGDTGEVAIRRVGEHIRLDWKPLDSASSAERYLTDMVLTSSMYIVNAICIDPIPVRKACFSYPRPENTSLLEQIFDATLEFDAHGSALFFDRHALNSPMIKLAREQHGLPSEQLRDLFGDDGERDPFLLKVRQCIARLLPTEQLSVDHLARDLGMSRRTLQRRLTDRGTNFIQVVSELRSDMSQRYLMDSRLGITEIAFMMGYADQASFSTAFRGWHSMSPSEFRKQLD